MRVKRQPSATVRITMLPHIAPDAMRVEIDCRYSTTGITSLPAAGLVLTRQALISTAAFAHDERCGQCDTSKAHDQGDQTIRAEAERAWSVFQQRRAHVYAESRRN